MKKTFEEMVHDEESIINILVCGGFYAIASGIIAFVSIRDHSIANWILEKIFHCEKALVFIKEHTLFCLIGESLVVAMIAFMIMFILWLGGLDDGERVDDDPNIEPIGM